MLAYRGSVGDRKKKCGEIVFSHWGEACFSSAKGKRAVGKAKQTRKASKKRRTASRGRSRTVVKSIRLKAIGRRKSQKTRGGSGPKGSFGRGRCWHTRPFGTIVGRTEVWGGKKKRSVTQISRGGKNAVGKKVPLLDPRCHLSRVIFEKNVKRRTGLPESNARKENVAKIYIKALGEVEMAQDQGIQGVPKSHEKVLVRLEGKVFKN